jgi:lipopolysaccharide heptosyltransferase II
VKRESKGAYDFSAKDRILVFEVNWLGDVLFSTPAIRAIRKKHPGAYIAALVVSRCRAVLLGNNYLDEVMVLDEEGRHRGFKGKLRLIRDLRVRRFSIAYLFKSSLTRTLCVFLAGIRQRIGYRGRKGELFLTEKVALPEEDMHRADSYYFLAVKTRIPDSDRYYDFFVSSDDRSTIEDFLKKNDLDQGKKMVVLHVGGNWDLKLWPKENFAKLIDIFVETYKVDVVITGSFMDYPLAKEIAAMASAKPFIACGLTTLKQAGVLFQRSELVISADSGPLHIALAMQARTVALFGPTSPDVTGPFGKGDFSIVRNKEIACVIPCYNLECKNNVCMNSITPEHVVEEIEKRGWLKKP